jgi:hypothetical protein
MPGSNGHTPRSRRRGGTGRPPAQVWPDDEVGLPPLDGIVPALAGFDQIGDASPLDIELRISAFLAELGAGSLGPTEADEPDHEQLVNGLVEVCLHHLEEHPPRVVVDFLWVLDAFDLGYVHWPLRERLAASALPSSPAWAMPVGDAIVTGTHLVTHDLGDGHDVVITARHPGATTDHVIAVYVDRNLDGLAKDILVHHDAAEFLQMSGDEPGMQVTPIDPAAAAAMIDDAMDVTFETGPMAPVAEQFGPLFSIVEHYVAKLPVGGSAPADPEPASAAEQEALVDRFLATGPGERHAPSREVLLDAVEFVVDELGGDPLRWSQVVTHLVVVGWFPVSSHGSSSADAFRAVLRDFIPWAHDEHGWAERYVDDVLAVLDASAAAVTSGDPAAVGRVDVLEQAMAAGIDLDDEAALDAFLDDYLDD